MGVFSSKSDRMFYIKKHYFEVISSCLDSRLKAETGSFVTANQRRLSRDRGRLADRHKTNKIRTGSVQNCLPECLINHQVNISDLTM